MMAQEIESSKTFLMERKCRVHTPPYKTVGIVSQPKNERGLEIGGILKKNVALLVKWLWRFPLGLHY